MKIKHHSKNIFFGYSYKKLLNRINSLCIFIVRGHYMGNFNIHTIIKTIDKGYK